MKTVIVFGVLGVYIALAIGIARFCAVNAGWERITRVGLRRRNRDSLGPDDKNIGLDRGVVPDAVAEAGETPAVL